MRGGKVPSVTGLWQQHRQQPRRLRGRERAAGRGRSSRSSSPASVSSFSQASTCAVPRRSDAPNGSRHAAGARPGRDFPGALTAAQPFRHLGARDGRRQRGGGARGSSLGGGTHAGPVASRGV